MSFSFFRNWSQHTILSKTTCRWQILKQFNNVAKVYLQPTLQLPVRLWREIPRMPRLCKWRSPENPCHQKIRKSSQHSNQQFSTFSTPNILSGSKKQHEKSHVGPVYFVYCVACVILRLSADVKISFCAAVKIHWCWELLCARLIWLGPPPPASCHNQQYLYIYLQ